AVCIYSRHLVRVHRFRPRWPYFCRSRAANPGTASTFPRPRVASHGARRHAHGGSWGERRSGQEGGAMDTPVASLVPVEIPTQEPDDGLSQRRVRTQAYALAGLAISGWMGFFLLAGILLASRPGGVGGPAAGFADWHPLNEAAHEAKA